METELPTTTTSLLETIIRRNSSTSSRFDEIDDQNSRYTSLKDIILHSPQSSIAFSDELGSYELFDTSNINIRNQLVKRAASAYVQSAAILVSTRNNRDILVSYWGRMLRGRCDGLTSRWDAYVRGPIQGCLGAILQFFASIVGNVRGTMNSSASRS